MFLHVQDRCQSQAYPTGTTCPVFWDRVYHCHSVDKTSCPVSPMTLSLPPLRCGHKPVQSCSAFMWVLSIRFPCLLSKQLPSNHLPSPVMSCYMETKECDQREQLRKWVLPKPHLSLRVREWWRILEHQQHYS